MISASIMKELKGVLAIKALAIHKKSSTEIIHCAHNKRLSQLTVIVVSEYYKLLNLLKCSVFKFSNFNFFFWLVCTPIRGKKKSCVGYYLVGQLFDI